MHWLAAFTTVVCPFSIMTSSFVFRTYRVVRDLTPAWGRVQLVGKLLPGVRYSSGFTYVPDAAPPGTGKTELVCWISDFAGQTLSLACHDI